VVAYVEAIAEGATPSNNDHAPRGAEVIAVLTAAIILFETNSPEIAILTLLVVYAVLVTVMYLNPFYNSNII
jgi:hypothetical protein